MQDVVHDVDIEVFGIVAGGGNLAGLQGHGLAPRGAAVRFDLDLSGRAAYVVRETSTSDICGDPACGTLQIHDVLDSYVFSLSVRHTWSIV
jgi:hypothetical protein